MRINDISTEKELDDDLYNELQDEALDQVFSNCHEAFGTQATLYPRVNTETKLLEAAFQILEKKYEFKMGQSIRQAQKDWVDITKDKISDGTYSYALDKAFRGFLNGEKFKNVFKTVSEKSKDTSDIGEVLRDASKENGLEDEMKTFTENILKNKFRKFYLDFNDA